MDAKTVDGSAARAGRRRPGFGLQHAARGRQRLGDRAIERRGLTLGGSLILFEATCEEPADTTVHAQGHLGHLGVGRRRQHHRTQRLAIDDEDGVRGDDVGVDVEVDRGAEALQRTQCGRLHAVEAQHARAAALIGRQRA